MRPGHDHRPARLRLSATVFAGLVLVLLWIGSPLGSSRPGSLALLVGSALGLTVLLIVCNLDRARSVVQRVVVAGPCLALLALWVVLAAAQLVPLPRGLLEAVAPASHAHWSALETSGPAPISFDPGATQIATLESLAYVAVLVLVMLVADSWRRLMLLTLAILLAGVTEALLGIGLTLAGGDAGALDAPVMPVNRNALSGLVEMAIAVSLGLSLLRPRWSAGSERLRPRFIEWVDAVMSSRAFLIAAQCVMVLGLLASGAGGALLAVTVAGAIGLAVATAPRRPAGLRGTALALVGAVAIGLAWWGPAALGSKIAEHTLGSQRAALLSASLALAAQQPLLGSGAGTYRQRLARLDVRSIDPLQLENAHNDYLEELVERGATGLACVVLAVLLALAHIVQRLRTRHGRRPRALLAGALIAAVAILVHSLYDAGLQIPANAAYFAALLGVGFAAAELKREPIVRMPGR